MSESQIIRSPAEGRILRGPTWGRVVRAEGQGRLLRGTRGAAGPAAAFGVAFGFENFAPGVRVSADVALDGPLPATVAASLAYTKTPPADGAVSIVLYDGATPFGTATWLQGETWGVLAFDGPAAPFVRMSVPAFLTPNPADSRFSHFSITFAG